MIPVSPHVSGSLGLLGYRLKREFLFLIALYSWVEVITGLANNLL